MTYPMTPRGETGNDFGVRPTAEGSAPEHKHQWSEWQRVTGAAGRVSIRYCQFCVAPPEARWEEPNFSDIVEESRDIFDLLNRLVDGGYLAMTMEKGHTTYEVTQSEVRAHRIMGTAPVGA